MRKGPAEIIKGAKKAKWKGGKLPAPKPVAKKPNPARCHVEIVVSAWRWLHSRQ